MTTIITIKPDPKAFAKRYAQLLLDEDFYRRHSED